MHRTGQAYSAVTALVLGLHKPKVRLTRDLTMFVLGGAAFAFETLTGGDRPNVLYGALALMGVAAYLRGMAVAEKDESRD